MDSLKFENVGGVILVIAKFWVISVYSVYIDFVAISELSYQ